MDKPLPSQKAIIYYGGFASRTGGAFMHAASLAEGLRSRGWEVETITLDRLPLVVRYIPHIVGAAFNRFTRPLGFYYKGVVTRFLYRHLISRRQTDVLVFEDVYLGWNSTNPAITILHAVWSDNLQSFQLSDRQIARLKKKEVKAIQRLRHPVVTVSQPYRAFLEQVHFGAVGDIKLDVIELGINAAAAEAGSRGTSDAGHRSLIYCGTLEARKNVFFMLDVFARIAAADPRATLTIAGDGPDRSGLEAYAQERRLNVTFLGRLSHDQVLRELPRHDIYIHTALKESFSFALLEAKLAGLTTCALSGLEVPAEFIDVGFDAFDADEWAAGILAVRGKPDMTAFPDYSIARMTDRTIALLSST